MLNQIGLATMNHHHRHQHIRPWRNTSCCLEICHKGTSSGDERRPARMRHARHGYKRSLDLESSHSARAELCDESKPSSTDNRRVQPQPTIEHCPDRLRPSSPFLADLPSSSSTDAEDRRDCTEPTPPNRYLKFELQVLRFRSCTNRNHTRS